MVICYKKKKSVTEILSSEYNDCEGGILLERPDRSGWFADFKVGNHGHKDQGHFLLMIKLSSGK